MPIDTSFLDEVKCHPALRPLFIYQTVLYETLEKFEKTHQELLDSDTLLRSHINDIATVLHTNPLDLEYIYSKTNFMITKLAGTKTGFAWLDILNRFEFYLTPAQRLSRQLSTIHYYFKPTRVIEVEEMIQTDITKGHDSLICNLLQEHYEALQNRKLLSEHERIMAERLKKLQHALYERDKQITKLQALKGNKAAVALAESKKVIKKLEQDIKIKEQEIASLKEQVKKLLDKLNKQLAQQEAKIKENSDSVDKRFQDQDTRIQQLREENEALKRRFNELFPQQNGRPGTSSALSSNSSTQAQQQEQPSSSSAPLLNGATQAKSKVQVRQKNNTSHKPVKQQLTDSELVEQTATVRLTPK